MYINWFSRIITLKTGSLFVDCHLLFAVNAIINFNFFHRIKVIFIRFYDLNNQIHIPILLGLTRNCFVSYIRCWESFLNIMALYSIFKQLSNWGCSSYANACSDPTLLDLYFSKKNKSSKFIFPVDMVHIGASTIVFPVHQISIHGK